MLSSDAIRLLTRLACFLPLAAALSLTDWISVQPAVRRRAASQLDAAADALISGRTIWYSADMRDLKPAWIARTHGPKEVLILGSSRLMQIPADWFRPRSMLNAAMSEGDLDDMVSIFELCLETGQMPQLVVLEVNPSLTLAGKSGAAPVLGLYFRRALLRYGIFPSRFFSGLFFDDGLGWDLRFLLQPPVWGISDDFVPGTYRVRPDGTADWRLTESKQTPDEVEADAISTMHRLTPAYRHWRTTSQPSLFDLKIFRAFLDDLRSHGIRVVVLLAPLHPAAYDFYTRLGGYNETWIRREMAARGIPVVGSYSPLAAKATKADFFDDVHAHRSVLHQLLSEAGII